VISDQARKGQAIIGGGKAMATRVEVVADRAVGGEEALRLPRRLEPVHLPFASSGRLVRVPGPIIEIPVMMDGTQVGLDVLAKRQILKGVEHRQSRDRDVSKMALLSHALLLMLMTASVKPRATLAQALKRERHDEAVPVRCEPVEHTITRRMGGDSP
jgi:hypothetical protein